MITDRSCLDRKAEDGELMKLSGPSRIWIPYATILLLATSDCVTKKYVGQRINVVDQRLTKVQTQTNQKLEKQGEISYFNERVTTTDNKLSAVANTAQQANETAGQALQQTKTNASAIQTNTSQIDAHYHRTGETGE